MQAHQTSKSVCRIRDIYVMHSIMHQVGGLYLYKPRKFYGGTNKQIRLSRWFARSPCSIIAIFQFKIVFSLPSVKNHIMDMLIWIGKHGNMRYKVH